MRSAAAEILTEQSADTCPVCREPFERRDRRQVTCRRKVCQDALNRKRNHLWCAEHRNVRSRNPWLLGPPPFDTHLPGGGFEMHVSPAPKWPIELRNMRGLHGMVTNLLGRPHHPTIPGFTLVPWSSGVRWGVYTQHDDDARRVAGREHSAALYGEPVRVRCGPLVRLRSPMVERRGRRQLRIDAITPVLVRESSASMCTMPTAANLHSTLDAWLPRRIGLGSFREDFPLELVERHTQPVTVPTGGKFGNTRGWEGYCIVETNAIGEWLLRVGALIGIGGRVALGFGRVRVTLIA